MLKTPFVGLAGSLLLATTAWAQPGAAGTPFPPTPVAQAFPGGDPAPAAATPLAEASADPPRTAHNSIFIELGGNGGIYTINYDRIVSDNFSLRAGLGYMAIGATASSGGSSASASVSMTMIPVIANFMVGSNNHKLELGAGLTFFHMSGTSSSLGNTVKASGFSPVGTAVAGYRYVPHKGGFTFRAGVTPLFTTEDFLPWGGVSFGYLF